jgi:hypothetical protein
MFVMVKVRVIADESGITLEIPGIMTPGGLLSPLVDYFIEKYDTRSSAWAKKVAFAVQLFLEYMHANPMEFDTHALFQNFAKRLLSGTVDPKTRLDHSDLYWRPRSAENRNHIISDLSLFFDWLGRESQAAKALNPFITPTPYDLKWLDAASRYRRQQQLLGHVWTNDTANEHGIRTSGVVRSPRSPMGEPPAFPDDRFEELFFTGFRVGQRVDYRSMLITLLMHGAGFRESEPFHLYLEDVVPDPGNSASALVRIHHPELGSAPWRDGRPGKHLQQNRQQYLMEQYGLPPRTNFEDARKAGWKNPRLDDKYYMTAHWFKPEYGEWFLDTWHRYLQQIVGIKRPHPFAFINLRREPRGEMYKISSFNEAHSAACRRIGLTVDKKLGTTPHGHRHAYGRRLSSAEVAPEFIRIFMHHASLESQRVYTQPSSREMLEALEAANQRLNRLGQRNSEVFKGVQ